MYVCLFVCMYVSKYACMYICMHVCMYVCVCVCVCMYVCMQGLCNGSMWVSWRVGEGLPGYHFGWSVVFVICMFVFVCVGFQLCGFS